MPKRLISEYRVTRHYGGPEEGGWWYDWWTFVRVVKRADPATTALPETKKDPEGGGIGRSSVLSREGDLEYRWEDTPGQRATKERPHYE